VSEEREREMRDAHARGDLRAVVELALAAYQVELYSFLCARLGGEADAHEVFAQMSEDLWRGIGGFEWRSSLRTWLYTLARHAAVRFERAPANQAERRSGLSQADDPAAAERSRTRPYQRTDVKDRFAMLRATLSLDEQSLLVLRVDRGLEWEDVARILHDGDDLDADGLRRQATNLRQRFQALKQRLRDLARAEGLLDDDP
jgi:RNA polymerase sigma-70 factor (ECF subfamily)